jgi:hypothetical protein
MRGQRGNETRNEVKDYTTAGSGKSESQKTFLSFFCNFLICLCVICVLCPGKFILFFISFSLLFPIVCVRDCTLTFRTKVFLPYFRSTLSLVRCSFFALLFLSLDCFAGTGWVLWTF